MSARIRSSRLKRHRKISLGATQAGNRTHASLVAQKPTLAAKLSAERHRLFVAREAELGAFETALADLSCSLLFVIGPAGVGKTSVLREYQRAARERGHPLRYIEASELARRKHEAQSVSFELGLEQRRAGQERRPVLLVDGYERLNDDNHWLLDQLGQDLSSDALLVLASRKRPPQRLLLDRAWANLTRQIEIEPWSAGEARVFLDQQAIPACAQEAIAELAQGYPLALAIAADVYHDAGGPDAGREFGSRDVERVHADLTRVLSLGAASRGQQRALDVCSVSQSTTVELLEHVLQNCGESANGAHELFDWLADRPFIDRVGSNLEPQLLARQTLLARLRRERKHDALLGPIREYWVNQLGSARAPEASLRALFFLDRDAPAVRDHDTLAGERAALEPARGNDHGPIVDLVRRLDGEESAELCRAHLRTEPEAFEVNHGGSSIDRVLHAVRLTTAGDVKLHERDPVTRLARQFLREHQPERGEAVLLVRWLMADEGYQRPSRSVLPLLARFAQITMGTPRITHALGVYRDPEGWQELWDAGGAPRAVIGRFTLDKRSYSLIAFSFAQVSLRDLLLDAGLPQSAAVRHLPVPVEDDQRRKIKQRVTDLARNTKLTRREAEVLELLCLGVTPEGIAAQLRIRPRTVKFHQENVLRKTGSATRIELFRRLI